MKNASKKLLSLLFAIVLFLQLFPIAFAENKPENYGETIVYRNPVYNSAIQSSPQNSVLYSNQALLSSSTEFSSIEEASEYLRECMKQRMGTVVVKYTIKENNFNSVAKTIIEKALEHTGIGNEGDYINWQYSGYSANSFYTKSNSYYTCQVTYNISYYTSKSQEDQVDLAVSNLLAGLNLTGKNDYEKIKAVYDWICQNVDYDYYFSNGSLVYTAYAALVLKKAVCQGYACLLYRLMNELGIDSRIISSLSLNHSWNIIKLGDLYYQNDVTWDANSYYYSYFLRGKNDFAGHSNYDDNFSTNSSFASKYVLSDTLFTGSSHIHTRELQNRRASTCKTEGHTGDWVCVTCGAILEKGTSIKKLSHTIVTLKRVEPTCTSFGLTEGQKCSVCQTIIKEQTTIAKAKHDVTTTLKKATLSSDGSLISKCKVCKKTTSKETIKKPASFSLSETKYVYSGKAYKPTVTVKTSSGKVIPSSYYSVKYENNKNVGKATVTIVFTKHYSGTKILSFKIYPKGTSISKLTAGNNKITVKVKKQTTQTTGYEIQYCNYSSFSGKTLKKIRFTDLSKVSFLIAGLKNNKTWYFRVRTFKTIGKTSYNSKWSSTKSVKLK